MSHEGGKGVRGAPRKGEAASQRAKARKHVRKQPTTSVCLSVFSLRTHRSKQAQKQAPLYRSMALRSSLSFRPACSAAARPSSPSTSDLSLCLRAQAVKGTLSPFYYPPPPPPLNYKNTTTHLAASRCSVSRAARFCVRALPGKALEVLAYG